MNKGQGMFYAIYSTPLKGMAACIRGALEDSGKASTCSMPKFGHELHVNTCMFVYICMYPHRDTSPNKQSLNIQAVITRR